jgi:hypothetical protein
LGVTAVRLAEPVDNWLFPHAARQTGVVKLCV